MERLEMVMTKMLTDDYYRNHREPREVLCKICRALLDDDFYTAVHILNDKLKSLSSNGAYIPEWQFKQFEAFSELSAAVSAVFVSRMEAC